MYPTLSANKTWGKSPFHYYNFAGKSVDWVYEPEERDQYYYHIGKSVSKQKMIQLGWTDKNVKYSFNNENYRSDDFENVKVITAGCSQTFGYGVDESSLWTKKLCDWYGTTHVNLGVPGSDWVAVGKRLSWWIPKLNPEIVCIYAPPTQRFSWWAIQNDTEYATSRYGEKAILECTIDDYDSNSDKPRKYPLLLDILDPENIDYIRNSSMEYIKNLCAHYNTKLFIVRRDDEGSTMKLQVRDDLARDLFHYGRKTHTNIFERMKEKIENNDLFSGNNELLKR